MVNRKKAVGIRKEEKAEKGRRKIKKTAITLITGDYCIPNSAVGKSFNKIHVCILFIFLSFQFVFSPLPFSNLNTNLVYDFLLLRKTKIIFLLFFFLSCN